MLMVRKYRFNKQLGKMVEVKRVVMRSAAAKWPFECVASGVHPSQAGELREFFRSHGEPTEVTTQGDPVYRDMNHRRRALKLRGLVDRSSFC